MRTIYLLGVFLVGCGGPEFTTRLFAEGTPFDGGADRVDDKITLDSGSGGSPGSAPDSGLSDAMGDAPDAESTLSTGGAPSGSGGSSSGGRPNTGGNTHSGGVSATGGALATGGTPATGGAPQCEKVTHDNGLGQTWQDCVPLGTYDKEQAMRACKAAGIPRCVDAQGCGAGNLVVIGYDQGITECLGSWGYGGFAEGFTATKDHCSSCPNSASGPTWD